MYHIGLEMFMLGSSSYKVAAVYHIDTSEAVVRSRLKKLRQEIFSIIVLHHYNVDKVLHIFEMVRTYVESSVMIINVKCL